MEKALIKFSVILSVLIISVITFYINKIFDFKKRKYFKEGYGCVEMNFKIAFFCPPYFSSL